MKKIVIIMLIGLSVLSCDKNQKAVRTLDGKWEATSIIISEDGFNLDIAALGVASLELDFENCKLKNEQSCDVGFIFSSLLFEAVNETFMYRVIDDGETLVIFSAIGEDNMLSIDELSRNNLEMTGILNGLPAKIEMEKQ